MNDLDRLRGLLAQAQERVDDLRVAVRVLEDLHAGKASAKADEKPPLLTLRRIVPATPKPSKPAFVRDPGRRVHLVAWMKANPGAHSSIDIARAIGTPHKPVASALYNMQRADPDSVIRDADGRWRLPE